MKHVIAGYGFVGKETARLFPDALIYDPPQGVGLEICGKFDYAHICVNTPSKTDGSCDTSAVEDVISKIDADLYICKSTVPPGTVDRLSYKEFKGFGGHSEVIIKNIVMMPEYVASSSPYPAPLADITKREFLIFGGKKENTKKARRLYEAVYPPTIRMLEVTALEAEVIKYSENLFIANKVSFCNEMFNMCELFKVDYDKVREGVFQLDPRMTDWFTLIFKNKRGWLQSHCLKKDVPAIIEACKQAGYEPPFFVDLLKDGRRYLK